jgi:hypothetical protein
MSCASALNLLVHLTAKKSCESKRHIGQDFLRGVLIFALLLTGIAYAQTPPGEDAAPMPLVPARGGSGAGQSMPRYDHIFVIVAENKSFNAIIGNPAAPQLNQFALEYGLATAYYGAAHPSEGNYIAMLGGSTFGIHDDDAWYCKQGSQDQYCRNAREDGYAPHSVSARSFMQQLEAASLTWKGYFEDLPEPGSLAIYNPSEEKPDPKRPDQLYAAKHNGFISFDHVRQDPQLHEKVVPLSQLDADLASGRMPAYAQIVLNQCNDMHGLPKAGTGPAPETDCIIPKGSGPAAWAALIRLGDKAIADIVNRIMAAPLWEEKGNNAIVIVWDEDDYGTKGTQGCCGADPQSPANFGGGHVPAIVITNHGPRGVSDPAPYNHYSLLRTCEEAFGMTEYLELAGADAQGVVAMTPLFAAQPEP